MDSGKRFSGTAAFASGGRIVRQLDFRTSSGSRMLWTNYVTNTVISMMTMSLWRIGSLCYEIVLLWARARNSINNSVQMTLNKFHLITLIFHTSVFTIRDTVRGWVCFQWQSFSHEVDFLLTISRLSDLEIYWMSWPPSFPSFKNLIICAYLCQHFSRSPRPDYEAEMSEYLPNRHKYRMESTFEQFCQSQLLSVPLQLILECYIAHSPLALQKQISFKK